MTITQKGLIIKETKVGEGNKIVTILTPELGKIQAGAYGSRSYKSKLIAGCQPFCYSNFVLSNKKDWYRITSAEPIETFYDLRSNIEKLSLAVYFCDLLGEVSTDVHGAEEIIQLALNTFYILTKRDNLSLIKSVFELRLMSISGFEPNLMSCEKCGSSENLCFFSVDDGCVYCSECGQGGSVSNGVLSAMRHIITGSPKKIFSFYAAPNILNELSSVSENYTLSQIGRSFRSLKYYLTISKNMI